MVGSLKMAVAAGAVLAGASVVCPLCVTATAFTQGGVPAQAAQAADSATARFHISGMFCATCPVTARLALGKVPGVFSAKVTIDDSLGVVRYDPRRVTPSQIAAELKQKTAYTATLLSDSTTARRKPRGG